MYRKFFPGISGGVLTPLTPPLGSATGCSIVSSVCIQSLWRILHSRNHALKTSLALSGREHHCGRVRLLARVMFCETTAVCKSMWYYHFISKATFREHVPTRIQLHSCEKCTFNLQTFEIFVWTFMHTSFYRGYSISRDINHKGADY